MDMIRDQKMDKAIETIIDIFNNVEGVELIRLTGLTKYIEKQSGIIFSKADTEMIIRKLAAAGVIKYDYIFQCPHCGEKSYILIFKNQNMIKLCDTCNTMYSLIENLTFFKYKPGM